MEEENLTDLRNLCSRMSNYQKNVCVIFLVSNNKKIIEKVKCKGCITSVTKQEYSKPEPYMDFVTSVNMVKLVYPAKGL